MVGREQCVTAHSPVMTDVLRGSVVRARTSLDAQDLDTIHHFLSEREVADHVVAQYPIEGQLVGWSVDVDDDVVPHRVYMTTTDSVWFPKPESKLTGVAPNTPAS